MQNYFYIINQKKMRHRIQGPDRFPGRNRRGDRSWFGYIIILVGILILFHEFDFPWVNMELFGPILLIVIGLLIGIKKRFQNHFWWILIFIGVANLVPEQTIFGASSSDLVWPLAFIVGGLFIVLRSGKKKQYMQQMQVVTSSENMLNIDVTFGGRKEIVTSKDFRGGNVTTTFGGTEINLVQADSTVQPMILNLRVSFGGVELIVPSHWEIQNEIEVSLAGVEDHRTLRTQVNPAEEKKILILRGSCSFGSVEIKSY
jgi:membrane-bound ClpP family serine protease